MPKIQNTKKILNAENFNCKKNIIAKKNIEYNELKAWLAQARQQAASTTASQMAFDASCKTGHLPFLTEMMDSGFADCLQLSSGSLL